MAARRHPAAAHGDQRLLQALAQGRSVKQAATEAGLSERTAYRRLAQPGFQTRLQALRDDRLTAALGELVDAAGDAVNTLKHLLHSNIERVRLAAAKALLEQLLKLRDTLTLEQRVAALERNQHAGKTTRKGCW